jgi:hypothetical protein
MCIQAEKKKTGVVNKSLRIMEEAYSIVDIPSQYIKVKVKAETLTVSFDGNKLNTKCKTLDTLIITKIRNALTVIADKDKSDKMVKSYGLVQNIDLGVLKFTFPRSYAKDVKKAIDKLDPWVSEAIYADIPPYTVEDMLSITSLERKRWTPTHLVPSEYVLIKKSGVGKPLSVPMYNPIVIRNITQETIQKWRDDHRHTVAKNRASGTKKAIQSRKSNTELRSFAYAQLKKQARDAAKATQSVDMQPLYYTMLLASIASRHAKEAQLRGNSEDKNSFYRLKECALKAVFSSN